MLVNGLSTTFDLNFLENFFTNQSKSKILITCLACAILFTVAAYVCYRRFWHGRQVQKIPPSQPASQIPPPSAPKSNTLISLPDLPSQEPRKVLYPFDSPSFRCLEKNPEALRKHLKETDEIDWDKQLSAKRRLVFDDFPSQSDTDVEAENSLLEFIDQPKPLLAPKNSTQEIESEIIEQETVPSVEIVTEEDEFESDNLLPQEQKEELPSQHLPLISPLRTPAQTPKGVLYLPYDTPSFDHLERGSKILESDLAELNEAEWLKRPPVRRQLFKDSPLPQSNLPGSNTSFTPLESAVIKE